MFPKRMEMKSGGTGKTGVIAGFIKEQLKVLRECKVFVFVFPSSRVFSVFVSARVIPSAGRP